MTLLQALHQSVREVRMKRYVDLKDDDGYQLSSWRLREELGIPGKLPLGSVQTKMVGDTQVRVISQETARVLHPGVNRPHRVLAICKHCNREVPAGRLQQHIQSKLLHLVQGERETNVQRRIRELVSVL